MNWLTNNWQFLVAAVAFIIAGYDLKLTSMDNTTRLNRIELTGHEREIRSLVYKRCDAENQENARAAQESIDNVLRYIADLGVETKMNMEC